MRLPSRKTRQPILRQPRQGSLEKLPVSSTYTYRSSRSDDTLRPDKSQDDQKLSAGTHSLLRRIGLTTLAIILLAIAFSLISLSTKPRVMSIDSSVVLDQTDAAKYQAAASKILSSSIWNRNKITVDTSNVSYKLTHEFPELSAVSVTVSLASRQPVVYVELVKPALALGSSNGTYALDSNGRAMFKVTNSNELDADVPTVTDQSGLKVSIGEQSLPSTDIGFIQTVVQQLSAKNFKVSSLTLPASTSELDVRLVGQPYYIKFNLANNDPKQQAGTFLAVIAQLQSQSITPKYIDVRVDGRAYYQ